jgi:hypothetical protein
MNSVFENIYWIGHQTSELISCVQIFLGLSLGQIHESFWSLVQKSNKQRATKHQASYRVKEVDTDSCNKSLKRLHQMYSLLPNILKQNRRKGASFYRSMATSSSNQNKPNNWRNNGTPEILIGGSIIALLGIDYFLQQQQKSQHQMVMNNLQSVIRRDEYLVQNDTEELLKQPVLFECIVRRVPKLFDGSQCLKGAVVGDRVSVLKERVGPDGMYNMCVKKENDEVRIGIFPTQCLEKIP